MKEFQQEFDKEVDKYFVIQKGKNAIDYDLNLRSK